MMIAISAFIAVLTGLTLTILTEMVKKINQRKVVAAKLFADSILTMKDILESDQLLTVAANSKKIYADTNAEACKKRLQEHLNSTRTKMKAGDHALLNHFTLIKSDKIGTEKSLYIGSITEDKYRNSTLLLSDAERALLPPRIQTMITEMIEHYFHSCVDLRYLISRLNEENFDVNLAIENYLEIVENLLKYYKDREKILIYSKEISNKNLVRSLLSEFRLQNF